jgi:hypothetical protein
MKAFLSPVTIALSLLAAPLYAQNISNYQFTVSSQNPTAYFKLDGSLASSVNPNVVLESFAGGYGSDVFRQTSNCWFFVDQNTAYLRNLSDSLISGGGPANSNATAKGSISFLFRSLSGANVGGQRFLFDATTTAGMTTTNHNAFSLFFENDTSTNAPNSLKLRFGDSTTVLLTSNNILPSTWYYFALTYDEARVPNKAIWYVGTAGGTLLSGSTVNDADAVAGEATGLIIGQRAGYAGAFRGPGPGRIDEFAIWARELTATEVTNQFSNLPPLPPPGATYQQVLQSQFPKYHFKLDKALVESIGNNLLLSATGAGGAFTADPFGNANSAYSFSETNDSLYITNDLVNGGGPTTDASASAVGTISFLFRMLSDTNFPGQRFVFSAPGVETVSTDDNQLALFFENDDPAGTYPNSLKLRVGNTTKGSTNSSSADNNVPVAYSTNMVPNAWYYFAMTYDESRNTPEVYVYFGKVGGTLTRDSMNPANASVVGNNGPLVLGNKIEFGVITNNAFRGPGNGAIDEFTIWHDELAPSEIAAQFAAAAPLIRPTLSIVSSGTNIIISWPADTASSFVLETTNVLDSTTISAPIWPSAGSPSLVGPNYVVTNSLSAGSSFYRLHKP